MELKNQQNYFLTSKPLQEQTFERQVLTLKFKKIELEFENVS